MSDSSSRSSGFEDPGRMVGGTEHRCLGLEDDTHRDPLKQGAKSALVEKGFHKETFGKLGKDLGRDTAAQVYAADRHADEGQVAGGSAVSSDKHIQGLHTEARSARQRSFGDQAGGGLGALQLAS